MKNLDLTKLEDCKEFKSLCDELKDNELASTIVGCFFDSPNFFDDLKEMADKVYSASVKKEAEEKKSTVVQNTENLNNVIDLCNKLENNPAIQSMIKDNKFYNDYINKIKNEASEKLNKIKINNIKKEEKPQKTTTNFVKKEIDNSVVKENEPVIAPRPSENTPIDAQLQIHALVKEYIDTMIKPYANGISDKTINDSYAGLYEMLCWVYNKN